MNYSIVGFSELSKNFVMVYYPEGVKHLIKVKDGKYRYDDKSSKYDVPVEEIRDWINENS
jgi:intergrase/recombinase